MATFGSLGRFTTSVEDLEKAGQARLIEGRLLFERGHYESAIVFGYYAVEIALKVCICRRLGHEQLPEVLQVHDVKDLLKFGGLYEAATSIGHTRVPRKSRAFVSSGHNPIARPQDNWRIVLQYTDTIITSYRYEKTNTVAKARATDFMKAIDGQHGVIEWLASQH